MPKQHVGTAGNRLRWFICHLVPRLFVLAHHSSWLQTKVHVHACVCVCVDRMDLRVGCQRESAPCGEHRTTIYTLVVTCQRLSHGMLSSPHGALSSDNQLANHNSNNHHGRHSILAMQKNIPLNYKHDMI